MISIFITTNITLNAYSGSVSCEQDSSGNAVMVWQFFNSSSDNFEIRAATFNSLTKVWSNPVLISDSDHNCLNPIVVVSSGGRANAIWCAIDNQTGDKSIQAAYRPAGGNWTSSTQITDVNEKFYNDYKETISDGLDNTCIVTWVSYINGQTAVRTCYGVAGSFTAPTTISN